MIVNMQDEQMPDVLRLQRSSMATIILGKQNQESSKSEDQVSLMNVLEQRLSQTLQLWFPLSIVFLLILFLRCMRIFSNLGSLRLAKRLCNSDIYLLYMNFGTRVLNMCNICITVDLCAK